VAVLFVVWMTNLYNFMDGIDGLAGGMTVLGFATLGVLGWLGGDPGYALAAWLVAAAALGFLPVNFPPARLFMGDVGSVPLGFLAAAFALGGVRAGLFALWVPVLVFSPFIVDATVTLARRGLRRERVWQAHRSHHYQRLVLMGWSHRKTSLAGYVIMSGAGMTAILLATWTRADAEVLAGIAWAVVYAAVALIVSQLERHHHIAPP
jgi:UDP-N-acetylmuramyl pentapeptide phosphotransferase/UDP-N-acetylglucosamine-1-phosphate transferase